jgi:V/A-type H+-transporting ATPase subunit D
MHVLARQRELLGEELRLTSQRVNLFEKVMIPSALDNIRVIRIALGDAQTAAVARAKLAKSKTVSVLSGKSSA